MIEVVKTEEVTEKKIKYLNINVSNSEVERKSDIVRLCADAGILEYVKLKTGHWIDDKIGSQCSCCGIHIDRYVKFKYCPMCGARMESEDKE